MEIDVFLLIQFAPKLIPTGPVSNKPGMVETMSPVGAKPLFLTMISLFKDAYVRHLDTIS